jgi:hypothetical protein
MSYIVASVVFIIVIALSSAFAFGICLAIVYGLMWVLHSLIGLPYAAASSSAFVLFMIGALMYAVMIFFMTQNKLLGLVLALYILLVMPVMYAAAFNAHRIWTSPEILGEGRYIPGEYWAYVSGLAGQAANWASSMVPALSGLFKFVESSPLLTGVVSSVLSTIVLAPFMAGRARKMQEARI